MFVFGHLNDSQIPNRFLSLSHQSLFRETRQHIIASLTGTNLSSQSSISTSIHRIFSRLATSVSSSLPGVGSSGGGMRRASEPCASSTTSNLFTQPSTTTISSFSSTAAILHNLRKHKLPAVEENLSTLLQQHHSTDSSSASTDFVSSLLDLIPKRIHPISSTPDPGSHSSPTSAATNSSSSSVELQDSPLDPHHAGPVSVCYYLSIHLFISDPHTIPGIPLERSIVAKIPFNLSCSNSADVEIEDDDDHHRRQHTGNHHHIHNQHASRRSSSSGAAASTTAASPPPPFQQIFSASSVAHMNTSTSLQGTPSSSLPIDIIMETSQQYEHRTRHGFSDPGVEIRRNQSRAMFR